MREGMAQAAGARLYRREDGGPSPGAPVILLGNSLSADHTVWDAQVPLLARRFRVLRHDTRGHGRSEAPEGPYDLPMLVADAVAVLDAAGVAGRCPVMGLSLGGMTALGLALAHPERVERPVCCGARADAPEAFARSWDERIAAGTAGAMQAILAVTVDPWLHPEFRAAHPQAVARVERMILATPVAGYIGCARALQRLACLPELSRIACPARFVVGSDDAGALPAVMRDMASRVPGSVLLEIARAAHLPNLDNATAFAASARGFLGLD